MSFKKILKKVLASIVMLSCVLAVSLEAPFLHQSYIRSIAEKNSVKIVGMEGMGTGFHVIAPSGKVYIMTNKHICQMTGPLKVYEYGSIDGVDRKIIKISEKHDLCLIEALANHKSGIKLSKAALENGDIAYTLGHPRGVALTVANGEKIDDKPIQIPDELNADGSCSGEMIFTFFGELCIVTRLTNQYSTPTYPGNSGSAIVNKYGCLVGVIFAGDPSVENQGFGVPLSFIKDFLSDF